MAFCLVGVVSIVVTLCLKSALLQRMQDADDDSKGSQKNVEGFGSDKVPESFVDKELELEAFYRSSECEGKKYGFTENPMLDASENTNEKKPPMPPESLELVEVNGKMKSENAELRRKNEIMSSELQQVHRHRKCIV